MDLITQPLTAERWSDLEALFLAKAVDELPVWSIVCFVVPPAFRH